MQRTFAVGKKYPDISGPLSDAFADELREMAGGDGFTTLVLDFAGTRMINSMAIGAIFVAYQQLGGRGKTLRIINASDQVAHVLRIVNLAGVMGEE